MPKVKDIAENFEKYREVLIHRGLDNLIPTIENGINDFKKLRELNKILKEKKTELNKINKEYIEKKEESLLKKAKVLKEEINKLEEEVKNIEEKISKIELLLPNWIHPEVPLKTGEEYEKPIRYIGRPKVYENQIENFIKMYPNVEFEKIDYEPLHHYSLVGKYIDQEKAGEISGSRFYYLFNELVILDLALSLYAIEFFKNKGYSDVLMITPYMMRKEVEEKITYFEAFQDALFNVEDNLILISTSEHPIIAYYKDKLFDPRDLPIKILAWTACFRKEAGAHGKDTKGIFRVKQFHKAEIHVITKKDEDYDEVFKLADAVQEFLNSLNLPNRSVIVPSGDMDRRALIQIDVQTWFPAEGKYRETHSIATMGTWVSEKLNMRYGYAGSKKELVRNVYATAAAVERLICAIVENHYNPKENIIEIPKVLHKYTLGVKEIKI
ncbi:MAG: serine--tRNA ligase [Candidatus Aenigmatarchaeota archaeon]